MDFSGYNQKQTSVNQTEQENDNIFDLWLPK